MLASARLAQQATLEPRLLHVMLMRDNSHTLWVKRQEVFRPVVAKWVSVIASAQLGCV